MKRIFLFILVGLTSSCGEVPITPDQDNNVPLTHEVTEGLNVRRIDGCDYIEYYDWRGSG